jgi:hypothetical protein
VIAFLKKSKTFLRTHFWTEDEFLLKDIGFLNHYIPSQHSKAIVMQDILERIDKSTPNQGSGWTLPHLS